MLWYIIQFVFFIFVFLAVKTGTWFGFIITLIGYFYILNLLENDREDQPNV